MDAPIDKDLPLKEDTRLLGRVLGDVLRAQTGEGGFARIEAIRQTAIQFRRRSAGASRTHWSDLRLRASAARRCHAGSRTHSSFLY